MKQHKIHKAWGVLAVMIVMITACAIGSASFATSLSVLKEAGGFTASQTSSIITVRTAAQVIIFFFTTRFYKWMKTRTVAVIALGLEIIAFVIFGLFGRSLYMCYIAAVLIGIGSPFIWTMGASIIINNWMKDHQALALSLASCGSGLASIVGAPVIQKVYDRYGVEATFLIQAAYILAAAILILVVVTDTPKEQGLEPYYSASKAKENSAAQTAVSSGNTDIPKSAVILVIAAAGMMGIAGTPSSINLSLNFKTMGIDPSKVALGISLFGFILILSKLMLGGIRDRLGGFKMTAIIGGIQMIGMFMCFAAIYASSDNFMFAAIAAYSLGAGIQALGYATWARDFSNETGYVRMFNYTAIATNAGELIGHELTGRIVDTTGLYNYAYLMYGIITAVVILMALTAYGIRNRAAGSSR